MARGAYDTTIMEEIRARGTRPSGRASEAGGSQRDEAVRRMNIRRGQRHGQGPSANSTAYTPENEGKTSSRSKSGREGHEDSPGRRRPGSNLPDKGPIPPQRPGDDTDTDVVGGYPLAPGYTRPGGTEPIKPRPGEPGGGPGSPPINLPPNGEALPVNLPIGPELIPLLVAAKMAPEVIQRMRRPSGTEVEAAIMQPGRSVGGVRVPVDNIVDAEYEVLEPERRLPAPAEQRVRPDLEIPKQIEAPAVQIEAPAKQLAPPPLQLEHKPGVEIDLGDEKETVKTPRPDSKRKKKAPPKKVPPYKRVKPRI